MKKFLTDLVERKRSEIADLQKRSDESQDLAEVRAIGETLKKLADEIKEAEEQLAKLDEENNEEQPSADEQASAEQRTDERSVVPTGAELRNAQVVSTFNLGGNKNMEENNKDLQYRNAFMEYVLRGTPIPSELRADANTTTGDAASVIPTHLVNQIIEKMENVGMILSLISRTSFAAGVTIPTSTVKPIATWVAEGAGSDRQKKSTGSVVFTYHKLRCEISMSMEVGTMALSAFEAKFVENVAKAMVYAIENAVINGTGSGQPKGILTEAGNDLGSKALDFALLAQIEGELPTEYEAGAKWCMNKKTFAKIQGLVDKDGQPVARVNYGVGKALERVILGRDVVVCPYVADDTMFMFDFGDYVLNTVYDMGISKKQDWETEDLLTKAVMSVDGKAVDAGSLIKVTITAAA
jgi:HK97 family phage major capsid protein